jgi:DNA-binding NtrC family response regulator
MGVRKECMSVLVVDDEPEVLSFFARILDASGMRALLARNVHEAVGIAKRGYVPIDLVLTDTDLKPDIHDREVVSGIQVVDQVRELRPDVRALYMSANIDSGVIRIKMKDHDFATTPDSPDDQGLIESIRIAATKPLVRGAHGRIQ